MKQFFLFLLMTLFAIAEDLSIGAGAYFQTQPYKGVSTILVPSPVIFYDNGIIYARWTRVGVYFYGKKSDDLSWGFSLTAQPRPNGYKPSDSEALVGLDEKKSTLEGGLAFTMYGGGKYFEAMVVHDLLGYNKSWLTKAEAGFKYKLQKLSLYPSVVVAYESQKFTRYYYGISSNEAARTSYPIYQPSGGVRFALQSYASYPLTKKLSAFFNLRADYLSKEAYNSPIVNTHFMYSGLASLLYTFEL